MESEQLQDRHDPGTGGSGGHPGTHFVQGHVLPHLGGAVLGEGQWVRGEYEVQEAHQCAEGRSEPDPKQTIHALVESDHQQSQCKSNIVTVMSYLN